MELQEEKTCDSNRETDQLAVDAELSSALWGDSGVGHLERKLGERLDTSKGLGDC